MALKEFLFKRITPLLALLLIISTFDEASSLSLFVDSPISTISGNNYPNLTWAVQALMAPDGYSLRDVNNTITLNSNTAGSIQYMPQFVVNGIQGGITIIFALYPVDVSALSDCNATLPTIIPLCLLFD